MGAVLLHKAGGVFTPRPCGKIEVVLDFFEIGWSVIVRSRLLGKLTEQTELSLAEAQGFLQWVKKYWWIDICGGKLLGRVDLRVDHWHCRNHMTIIQESPRANNSVGRFRIGCGRHGGRPSQGQEAIQRSQHRSMPFPLIDDESCRLFTYEVFAF